MSPRGAARGIRYRELGEPDQGPESNPGAERPGDENGNGVGDEDGMRARVYHAQRVSLQTGPAGIADAEQEYLVVFQNESRREGFVLVQAAKYYFT